MLRKKENGSNLIKVDNCISLNKQKGKQLNKGRQLYPTEQTENEATQ
jgi:hypothetical protein